MFTVFLFITAKSGNSSAVVQPMVKKNNNKKSKQTKKTTLHPCLGILLSNKKRENY